MGAAPPAGRRRRGPAVRAGPAVPPASAAGRPAAVRPAPEVGRPAAVRPAPEAGRPPAVRAARPELAARSGPAAPWAWRARKAREGQREQAARRDTVGRPALVAP